MIKNVGLVTYKNPEKDSFATTKFIARGNYLEVKVWNRKKNTMGIMPLSLQENVIGKHE